MTNQSKAELLHSIAALCERYPHWRFGQLVANVAGWSDRDVWDVEDAQLLDAVRSHLLQIDDPHDATHLPEAIRAVK